MFRASPGDSAESPPRSRSARRTVPDRREPGSESVSERPVSHRPMGEKAFGGCRFSRTARAWLRTRSSGSRIKPRLQAAGSRRTATCRGPFSAGIVSTGSVSSRTTSPATPALDPEPRAVDHSPPVSPRIVSRRAFPGPESQRHCSLAFSTTAARGCWQRTDGRENPTHIRERPGPTSGVKTPASASSRGSCTRAR